MTFPGGIPGAGLLLLRIALGVTAIIQGGIYLFEEENLTIGKELLGFFAVAGGTGLLIGVLTPILSLLAFVSIVIFISVMVFSAQPFNLLGAFYLGVISAALILLGPGALSVDAYLFGRREIIIPSSSPHSSQS